MFSETRDGPSEAGFSFGMAVRGDNPALEFAMPHSSIVARSVASPIAAFIAPQSHLHAARSSRVATPSIDTPVAPVQLILAGARGRVASAFRQLLQRAQRTQQLNSLRFAGAFDRRAARFHASGFEALELGFELPEHGPQSQDSLIERLSALQGPKIFIDATGSREWADAYPDLLRLGVGIVTPNKHAFAGGYARWQQLHDHAAAAGLPLHYETTVGAALPVLSTLQSLRQRGERIVAIEGVLSGSLSFILDQLQGGKRLSEAVAEAIQLGYTEPDPLEDLCFRDVCRKLLILSRSAGHRLEPQQVRIDALLPEATSLSDLLTGACDADWQARVQQARAGGQKLVALASWQIAGEARISVRSVGQDSPLAQLAGGENIIRIRTEFHDAIPITIKGPGAGPEVTAAGLFGDVLQAVQVLNRRHCV